MRIAPCFGSNISIFFGNITVLYPYLVSLSFLAYFYKLHLISVIYPVTSYFPDFQMAGMPVVRLHAYEAAFEIWAMHDGPSSPLIFVRRFPLALYVLWVTCRATYLGQRFDSLRRIGWTSDQWFLSFPLTLPHAVVETGPRLRIFCYDFCLGRVEVLRVIQDLMDFFQCQVTTNSSRI
jgi:hypothetical protein